MVRRILLAAVLTLAASGAQAQPLGQFSNSGPIDFGRPLLFDGAAIRRSAPSVSLRPPVETIKPDAGETRLPNVKPADAALTPPLLAEPPPPTQEPAPAAAQDVKK